MKRSLLVIGIFLASARVAVAQDDFSPIKTLIDQRSDHLKTSQNAYVMMQARVAAATRAYAPAAASVRKCQRDLFAPLMADAYKKLQDANTALDSARDAIADKDGSALKAFKTHNQSLAFEEIKFKHKVRDITYWQGVADDWLAIETDYSDPLDQRIIPIYIRYAENLELLNQAMSDYGSNCHGKEFSQLAMNLINAINPVALAATAIKAAL